MFVNFLCAECKETVFSMTHPAAPEQRAATPRLRQRLLRHRHRGGAGHFAQPAMGHGSGLWGAPFRTPPRTPKLGSECLFFFGGKFMAKVCLLERLEVKWWWWNWCWDADNLINDSSFWDGKSWKSWNSRWINRWSDFGRTCMEMWGETGRRRSKIWDRLYNDILRGPHILIQGGTYRIRRMLFCRLYQAISKWFGTHVNAP